MAKNVFSVPIFFILFRESLEAAIIVAVLLSLVEQIVLKAAARHPSLSSQTQRDGSDPSLGRTRTRESKKSAPHADTAAHPEHDNGTEHSAEAIPEHKRLLIRKMRIQVFAGAGVGLLIAVAIGAAFIAVWFTKVVDLFSSAEEVWEGTFNLIACILIFVMGLTMLRMDRAKEKWRVKLSDAFEGKVSAGGRGGQNSRWVLFVLPLVTVLREGLEAVVFVGGVSLGQPATSIPLAAIIGLICGLLVGYIIYASSSRTSLSAFLVASTSFLLLIGAGLFSKAVGAFERYKFNTKVGGDVAEAGNGPGSYDVVGNIWHLDCCNPENKTDALGWSIFNAIFGWSNNGSVGTVLAYVFYWVAVITALIIMKHNEGRTNVVKRFTKSQEA
ncbi:plasma membrane iron permease [Ceratobasidium sp. AG-Ba]|nr:plasma membrane iron permease [Ceratobasidium sp. AG-Ba]QRW08349.1 plasma membrane iron permease [Ceratobasidium sp. AG-Ba]